MCAVLLVLRMAIELLINSLKASCPLAWIGGLRIILTHAIDTRSAIHNSALRCVEFLVCQSMIFPPLAANRVAEDVIDQHRWLCKTKWEARGRYMHVYIYI